MNAEKRKPNFPTPTRRRTKIVATIGPASNDPQTLREMILAGADVLRLNFAHRGAAENSELVETIRRVAKELDRPVAILADLAGPKIRLGELKGGEFECRFGEEIRFVRGTQSAEPSDFTSTYSRLVDDLKPGDRVLLADGTVALTVASKTENAAICRVVRPGVVRSRQGINLPGVDLGVESLSSSDRENAIWSVKLDLDFVGMSFVRSAADVRQLREIFVSAAKSKLGDERWNEMSDDERALAYPSVVAKIEKSEALERLDEIVAEADAVMVARGDLGVEIDVEKVAVAQKRILKTCLRFGKPSIVATQALESMIREQTPTRAEVSDVSNSILDGADACMTSAETAVGKYPVRVVETMSRIAFETEKALRYLDLHDRRERFSHWSETGGTPLFPSAAGDEEARLERLDEESAKTVFDLRRRLPERRKASLAVCDAAGRLADATSAAFLFAWTRTGRTALNISNARHTTPTIGTSSNDKTLRRMCLYWGVTPVYTEFPTARETFDSLVEAAVAKGFLSPGDRVVLTFGARPELHWESNAICVDIVGS